MSKVLVDIDGVLNPFLAFDLQERGFIPVNAVWATWMLHFEHGGWMREIAQDHELVWASSWEEDSQRITTLFDLPSMDYVPLKSPPTAGTWKLPDVQSYLANTDEPVVWWDDEFEEDAFDWAQKRPRTLLIPCDPAVGLTRDQVDQTLRFLRNNAL